jgi:hypothetical protein
VALVRALWGLLAVTFPALVSAQDAPRLPVFRPDVTFGFVFDDNVFMRPEPEGDIFIRLTPGFDVVHDSNRLKLDGSFRFDAERYQERPDLNEAVARQASLLDLIWRPNRRIGFISRVGYRRTQTPQDLNVTTGLTGGRQPASRLDLSLALENAIRPHRLVLVGGDFEYDDVLTLTGIDSSLRAVRLRYTEELDPRSQLYFNYRLEQREFVPGPVFVSHVGVAGWSYRLTPDLLLALEGGPRVAEGEWSPEVSVQATKTIGTITTFSAGYAHTQDVAVGVVGLIDVHRLTTAVALRRNEFWELVLSAGAFRNVQPDVDSIAYDFSVAVGRSLTKALWLVVSVNRTFNDLRRDTGEVPQSEIVRNWVMASIRVQPVRPR